MMNARLLVFAALAWLAWRFWQQWQQKMRGPQPPPSQQKAQPKSKGGDNFELMQRCTVCGTYLPSTALSRSGRCGRCSD
jgi:threonine/homoserine/homoserine lactone efflux protein